VITEKFARREEILTGMLEQRQARLAEHESGRKLLSDEVSHLTATLFDRDVDHLFLLPMIPFKHVKLNVELVSSFHFCCTGAYPTQYSYQQSPKEACCAQKQRSQGEIMS
jgi:hypothetical protein